MRRARMAQSGATTPWMVATAIRAEIFALADAVSENTRIGQLTPDLLTPLTRRAETQPYPRPTKGIFVAITVMN
jgi:hypothetical protein